MCNCNHTNLIGKIISLEEDNIRMKKELISLSQAMEKLSKDPCFSGAILEIRKEWFLESKKCKGDKI